jgi:O-antigen ligase
LSHPSPTPSWFARLWLGALLLALPFVQLAWLEDALLTPGTLWVAVSGLVCLGLLFLRPSDSAYRQSRMRSGLRIYFIFALVYGVALPDALHLGEALIAWSRMAQGALVLYLTWQALREGESARRFAGRIASLSLLLQTGWALPLLFAGAKPFWSPFDLGTSTIALSEWCVMMLPFVAMSLRNESHKVWRWLSIAALVLTAAVVLLSVARASLLAMAAWVVVFALAALWQRKRIALKMRWKPLLIAAGSLVALLLLVFLLEPSKGPFHRMEHKWQALFSSANTSEHPTGLSERQALWQGTQSMIAEHWTSGVGPGQWKYHAPRFGAYGFRTTYADRFFEHPHNDVLWVFSEGGLPSLVAWLFFLGWCAAMLLSTLRRGDADRALGAACGLAALAAFLVLGMVSYPLSQVGQTVTFLAVMAWAADRQEEDEDTRRTRIAFRLQQGFLLVLGIGVVTLGVLRLRSEWRLAQGKEALRQMQLETAEIALRKVDQRWLAADREGLPVAYYQGLAARMGGQRQREQRFMEEAVAASPYHPPVLLEAGRTAMQSGQHNEAAARLRAVLGLHDCHFEARLLLAEEYMSTSKFELAKEVLQVSEGCTSHVLYPPYREQADKLIRILPEQVTLSLDSLLDIPSQ